MFRHLLVPLDGTPEAASALPVAVAFARLTGADISLVRVVRPPVLIPTSLAADAHDARMHLDRVAMEPMLAGRVAGTAIRRGDVADEIVAAALEGGADLIVMATHGRSGLGRLLLGSVTERVLAHSPLPVLLRRPGAADSAAIKTVLVPVDGSPGSLLALAQAAEIARQAEARIVLVEAVTPFAGEVYAVGLGLGEAVYIDPDWEAEAREAAERRLTAIVAGLAERGIAAEWRVEVGHADQTIVRTATAVGADLIVISTHALTGPPRALLGSVADAVARSANCPVLLVRRPDSALSAALADDTVDAAPALPPAAPAGAAR